MVVSVVVPVSCRSDRAIAMPVVKRMEEDDRFEVDVVGLNVDDFVGNYLSTWSMFSRRRPDVALIFGDRPDMIPVAICAFESGIPIAHAYAGVTNRYVSTRDDIYRHCVTLMSDVQFCESTYTRDVVVNLMKSAGLSHDAHVVGITHFDDDSKPNMSIIDCLGVAPGNFDLVLYNPPTYGDLNNCKNKVMRELNIILSYVKDVDRTVVFIDPNPDALREVVRRFFVKNGFICAGTVSKSEFYGLLKGCNRFITNSSSAWYEAPIFVKENKIIHIGSRNRVRSDGIVPAQIGASKKILDILYKKYGTACSCSPSCECKK